MDDGSGFGVTHFIAARVMERRVGFFILGFGNFSSLNIVFISIIMIFLVATKNSFGLVKRCNPFSSGHSHSLIRRRYQCIQMNGQTRTR